MRILKPISITVLTTVTGPEYMLVALTQILVLIQHTEMYDGTGIPAITQLKCLPLKVLWLVNRIVIYVKIPKRVVNVLQVMLCQQVNAFHRIALTTVLLVIVQRKMIATAVIMRMQK